MHSFHIPVSQYLKKNKEQDGEKFIFCSDSESDLEQWIIVLEFSRAKAIYEEFVYHFGKIQFPMNMNLNAYDQAIVMMLNQKNNQITYKKKIEEKDVASARTNRGSRHQSK